MNAHDRAFPQSALEADGARHLRGSETANLDVRRDTDADDPAFSDPTKFVGPVYDDAEADRLAAEKDWVFKRDGDRMRRVVPSSPWKTMASQPARFSSAPQKPPDSDSPNAPVRGDLAPTL